LNGWLARPVCGSQDDTLQRSQEILRVPFAMNDRTLSTEISVERVSGGVLKLRVGWVGRTVESYAMVVVSRYKLDELFLCGVLSF
jgi:hypothetical protein